MKTIGILGGLGPAASCRLYDMLIRMHAVTCDQDHPDIVLYSKASVPDRTAFLLGNSEISPLPALVSGLQTLHAASAQVLAMPCATAHHFIAELQAAVDAPLLDMLALTARHLAGRGITHAGLLCTLGSYHSGAFVRALQQAGIDAVVPDDTQAVMDVINAVKLGKLCSSALAQIAQPLLDRGAQTVILGCTELSLLAEPGEHYTDPMHILAQELLS
ncbi:MAG: amino acid racemase [Oscillospiraceae bacterium]|nr:amino acid racemase [Oscillospiraceae bacterium]